MFLKFFISPAALRNVYSLSGVHAIVINLERINDEPVALPKYPISANSLINVAAFKNGH